MANSLVQELFKKTKVLKWQVAAEVEMSDTFFSKKLRTEMDGELQERVLSAIQKLAKLDDTTFKELKARCLK